MNAPWPKIPSKIKGVITDTTVKVAPPGFDADAFEVRGLYDASQEPPVIYVGNWLPTHAQWQVFIHELLHKLEDDADLTLIDKDIDDEPSGKNIYDRLATAFLATWRLNNWKLPGE
ncbi:MAG: hypothetical protein KOO63_04220 [Bacteroidales bacterium]|nr:hypothetical protein [Candidatus Latescibacterota bacterium]